ncbi:glycosyltransferase family 4 protein [Chitinophaga nivalis]|uniref:Glycosyltransferase family 4 protein n=1 Tax=Chitinophaga nivalis TaxID=2991709 RepID=A0ABT3IWB8_9BACT|nr:glycosyltransferase family 4 protein [Chitinophaga nivalis]MCW3462074.1 glycosyltransferase family 4 protein [Chitinophaga nivalis]MCW3488234.1 glycosyltransferase family 4 protein [Chitinophaga nivalis]
MKVVHIITGLGGGGAEKFVFNICRELINKGYSQKVIVLNDNQLDLLPLFTAAKIEVTPLNIRQQPFALISKALHFARLLRQEKNAVLHAHMFHSLVFACLIKLFHPGIKIVFTSHNFNIGSRLREVITFLLKPFRSTDILFSRKMHRKFYKDEANCRIIPNGIPTAEYDLNVKKEETYTFICVARLEKVKNQKAILVAANKLHKEGLPFKVWLVGQGDMSDELKQYAATNHLNDVIVFKGFSQEIPTLMNQANCFLLPSLWEGMPLSILEAAASGLPVVCTAVGSIPEFFSDELITYTAADDLYPVMKKVLEASSLYAEKGQVLKQYVREHFDIATTIQQHLDVYKQLAKY